MKHIKLYNKQMKLKAYLENAYKIKYNPPLNELWTAGFSLPYDDMKRKEIETFDYVEIFDNDKRIGMFRIMDSVVERDELKKIITYDCEHVLSTLMDSVLFGLHQRVNLTTKQNIEYLLSKQKKQHWKLGQCDFVRYFHYNWENESTLLGPMYSIPKPFDERYQWTWDDSSYPWTLNLVRLTDEITAEIRYKKNMKGIKRHIESKEVMTRIYPLGYGEGVNQLTIKDVNGGVPYLDAPTSILDQYEGFDYIWVDRRFKDAKSLYDSAKALLLERCVPKVTYEVDAIDYELIDPYKLEKFRTGKLVRVIDEELGVNVDVRVINGPKDDVGENPLDIKLTLGNKLEDLGTTQADLEKRQKVNEVYAQGSTNLLAYSYNDNADKDNPAVIKFYLPDDLVNINTLELTYETEEFRTYGATTESTPTEIKTSSSGGGTVTSTSAGGEGTYTSSAGGQTITSTSSGGQSSVTSESGGQASVTSESGGQGAYTSNSGGGTTQTTDSKIFGEMWIESDDPIPFTDINYHRHQVKFKDQFNHSHAITIPAHSHAFSLPSHSHQVTLPSHKHEVTISPHDHTVEIPSHRHDISHGIFRLSQTPSKVTIKVDGNPIPVTAVSGENIDLISYLSKGTDGKIERGKWHEVEILPDKLGRINANIISRLFISSNIGRNF